MPLAGDAGKFPLFNPAGDLQPQRPVIVKWLHECIEGEYDEQCCREYIRAALDLQFVQSVHAVIEKLRFATWIRPKTSHAGCRDHLGE